MAVDNSPDDDFAKPGPANTAYAGFWWRVLACLIDTTIILVVLIAFYSVLSVFFVAANKGAADPQTAKDFMKNYRPYIFIFDTVLFWLYYALMESSAWRATLGKRACGLVVTDLEGRRLSFGRATGRYFAKYISNITLCIGYMMAGWTKRKQALHDMVADTLVMKWT